MIFPLAKGKMFASKGGVVDRIVGGWTVGTVFILVDSERNTKDPAFDHTRLAVALSHADRKEYSPCVPAQQTIPLLVRWMLVLEGSDEKILYLAKGVPREWVASGKPIEIQQAPTRWGRVSFSLITKQQDKSVVGHIELIGATAPKELHFKLRLPARMALERITVNGEPVSLGGVHGDTVMIGTKGKKQFEVVGQIS